MDTDCRCGRPGYGAVQGRLRHGRARCAVGMRVCAADRRCLGPIRRGRRVQARCAARRWRVPRHRQGFPCCVHSPLAYVANTPAEPIGARVARFPIRVSLPRFQGGSASALPVSRPARRSLRVTARALAESPTATLCHRSASTDVVTSIVRSDCYRLERQVPGGDSHPLRNSAFSRRI